MKPPIIASAFLMGMGYSRIIISIISNLIIKNKIQKFPNSKMWKLVMEKHIAKNSRICQRKCNNLNQIQGNK